MSGLLLAALVLAAAPVSDAGAAAGYQLYPVRGLFLPADEGRARIDPDFRAALSEAVQGAFEEKFRQRFPQSAQTISERNQRRTFAVSMQVARASRYTVAKLDGTTDLYLPVTASLYFTNVMTGEVLFASTRTTIATASVLPAQAQAGSARVVALFGQTLLGVMADLIADAGVRFTPTIIEAKVLKRWESLAILNRGAAEGLARGDALTDAQGQELRVLYAGPSYAIASAALGSFEVGAVFARVTNRTLADFTKPRALALLETVPEGLPAETVVQLFSDALGAAPLSLVPVNPTFASVLRALGSQLDVSQEKLTQRELPGLFIRLHVPDPVVYERATNHEYQSLRVTEALAFAEVVDRSGRVLFATQGRDRIEDEITAGMALSLDARREIALKNALGALARRLTTDFKPLTARLELERGGEAPTVKDGLGRLAPGATVRAFRKLKVDGLEGEVLAPTWELEVGGTQEVTALTPLLPVFDGAPALQRGDVVLVEVAAGDSVHGQRLGPCGPADQLGDIALPGYDELAFNLFASGARVPFLSTGLPGAVARLLGSGAGFKQALVLREPQVGLCVQPAYKIGARELKCDERTCTDSVSVKVGFRLRTGGAAGAVKSSFALDTRMTTSALPRGSALETRDACLRADLLDEVLKLAPAAAAGLVKEKP